MRAVFWWYTGVAATAMLAYPSLPMQVQQVLYLIASGAAVLAVCWGVRINRPAPRSPWLLLIAGLSCTFAADVTFTASSLTGTEPAFPSGSDVLYLLFYPLVFLSLGSFLKASGQPDRAAWLDASVWTIGAAAVLWEFLLEPYIVDASAGPLSVVVALAYPLLDLALLLMVVRMLAGRQSMRPALLLLTMAMLANVITDFVYGVRVVQGSYAAGELTDSGWLLYNLLVGAAALHPSMVRLTHPAKQADNLSRPRQLQALLIPALAAPGLLLYQLASGELAGELQDGLFMVAIVAFIIILIVIRGSGLLRIAGMRSTELATRSAALEAALDDRERVGRDLRTRVNQDALTGLASRDRFVEMLQAAIDASTTGSGSPSVAFLDLDDFKSVNDTLGHEAGDLLLVEIARRIRNGLGPEQLVARFGGDEFAILVHGDAGDTAERLVRMLRLPVLVHGREIRPRVSVGVTTARSVVSCSSSDLLREADVAMYVAKRRGGGWARYQSGMSSLLLARLDLRHRLTEALQQGDIQPWFQPVVDLDSGRLLGFEALARWCSEGIPILASIEWLPFAEESGLVVDVDRVMLRSAVAQLATWRKDAPYSELELAINLSGRTLQQEGIDDEVLQALHVNGVPAHRLVVEVTEGVLINDTRVGDRLRRLRTAGVRIALDDFGTGWASLSYLRHLPVDHLKLDQSFTADLGRQPEADAIPSAIAHLARGLSLGLVAEGVETIDQRQRLLALGFRIGQGYLFGRAQPPADLRKQVQESRPLLEITDDEHPTK